ncbi:MAG TPA: LysM peptidoglycan-binding domain-containing protein [Steroidobacteraceae bacterium]|nr:LysM peptidoglycan-binding domain-containing protein [Steroidobacteraceae bacterium]
MSGLLSGLAVLTFASGCQTSSQTPASATPAPTRTPVATTAPIQQQNAIEAALAREATMGSSPAPAAAPTTPRPVMNANAPLSYTVQRGDTLWDISSMFLRDPWLWPEIWHVNPTVQNPHLIYPGDVLTLAYGADGSPQVTLARGDAVRVQPLVRSSPLEGGAIPTIPYASIAAFLGKPSLLTREELDGAPRVAALRDRHLIGGVGSDLFVKDMTDHGPGRYNIVRIGDELKDPDDGRVLGYMGVFAGVARVDAVAELTRATVLSSARETAAGDVLLAEDTTMMASDIIPHAPTSQIDGRIIAVVDGVSLIGQFQVVALNRGASHGLGVGHVLAIDRDGGEVRDGSCRRSGLSLCKGTVRLPNDRAGSVLVFKTYEQMSYGLVLETTMPVAVLDLVRTP